MTINTIISAFEQEFEPLAHKFEIIKLVENNFKVKDLTLEVIEFLKLPSDDYNIVWHPGVYVFFGNGKPYRIGRHLINSRHRVMQHLDACTSDGTDTVWDIKNHADGEILLFNVKEQKDYHWVAALEIFLETRFKSDLVIPAKRQG